MKKTIGIIGIIILAAAAALHAQQPVGPRPVWSGTYANRPTSATIGTQYVVTDDSSTGACAGGGSAKSTCWWDGTAWTALSSGGTSTHTISIPIAGAPIGTGTGSVGIPGSANFSCTINKAQIVGNTSGSITVDVWKAAAAIPSSGNKISASAPVTLSSAQLNQNSALTGWTTTVTAGDVFWATVATVDGTLTGASVSLTCQ